MNLQQFKQYTKDLGLITMNANDNAQFLIHGVGQSSIDCLDKIYNEGLVIKNKQTANHGDKGILSLNYLCNDAENNHIDFNTIDLYNYGTGVDQNGYGYNVITALPQSLGNLYLGRVMLDRGKANQNGVRNCLLDNLGMDRIPPEFIVAFQRNHKRTGETAYLVNSQFYALDEENTARAVAYVQDLLNQRPRDLYSDLVTKHADYLNEQNVQSFMSRENVAYRHNYLIAAIKHTINEQQNQPNMSL